jgi:hypothetical protein
VDAFDAATDSGIGCAAIRSCDHAGVGRGEDARQGCRKRFRHFSGSNLGTSASSNWFQLCPNCVSGVKHVAHRACKRISSTFSERATGNFSLGKA